MYKKMACALPLVISGIVMAQTNSAPVIANLPVEIAPTLDKHVHGIASLDIAIEGNELSLELDSPAFNLVGFEYEAKTDEEKAAVNKMRTLLDTPLVLFGIPQESKCVLTTHEVEIPVAGHDHPHDDDDDDHDHEHSDVEAAYKFQCTDLAKIKNINLNNFFANFPATEKINVQLVSPNGQASIVVTKDEPKVSW